MPPQSTIRSLAITGLVQVFLSLASAFPTPEDNSSISPLLRPRTAEVDASADRKSQKTWMIVGGGLVGGAILCTLIWMFFRWNLLPRWLNPARFFTRQGPSTPNITSPLHSTTTTTTSSAFAYKNYRRGVKPSPYLTAHSQTPSESRSSLLYCDNASTASYSFHKPSVTTPLPALARGDDELTRSATTRRYLIREDLLTSKSQQNSHTFFDDAASWTERRLQIQHQARPASPQSSSSLPLQKPLPIIAKAGGQYVPPPIPPSPTTSERNAHYSWMSAKSGKTNRTSVESEPPKFRGLEEWVGNQAVRVERGKVKGLVREKQADGCGKGIVLEERVMVANPMTERRETNETRWYDEKEERKRRVTQESLF